MLSKGGPIYCTGCVGEGSRIKSRSAAKQPEAWRTSMVMSSPAAAAKFLMVAELDAGNIALDASKAF